MDALETFSQIVGFWPASFKPRETWRAVALEELGDWGPDERAGAVRALQTVMGRAKSVDIETLRKARNAAKVTKSNASGNGVGNADGNIVGNIEAAFLSKFGLLDTFKKQAIGDRVMISRLIRCVVHTPGWESILERQMGSAQDFKDWERIENLAHAAENAYTPTSHDKFRKACYPNSKEGWEAPKEPIKVVFTCLASKVQKAESAAGLRRISEIAAKHGGFSVGQTSNVSQIYHSPEYQRYLKDYTARTGLKPG